MMKKKKKLSLALSSVITIGILGSVPAFAATNPSAKVSQATGTPSGERHKGHQKGFKDLLPPKMSADQLKKKAEKLGIKTSGKDTATLFKEIRDAQVKKEAKKLGISTTGKDTDTLFKEIRDAQVNKDAKELGISTTGKIQGLLQKKFVMPVFLKMLKS